MGGKEIDIGIIDHISHFGHTESHGRTGKAIKVKKVMIINKVNCSFGSKNKRIYGMYAFLDPPPQAEFGN